MIFGGPHHPQRRPPSDHVVFVACRRLICASPAVASPLPPSCSASSLPPRGVLPKPARTMMAKGDTMRCLTIIRLVLLARSPHAGEFQLPEQRGGARRTLPTPFGATVGAPSDSEYMQPQRSAHRSMEISIVDTDWFDREARYGVRS